MVQKLFCASALNGCPESPTHRQHTLHTHGRLACDSVQYTYILCSRPSATGNRGCSGSEPHEMDHAARAGWELRTLHPLVREVVHLVSYIHTCCGMNLRMRAYRCGSTNQVAGSLLDLGYTLELTWLVTHMSSVAWTTGQHMHPGAPNPQLEWSN